jgi:hypothetical protein
MNECQPTVDNIKTFIQMAGSSQWENKTVVLPYSTVDENLAKVFISNFDTLNLNQLVIANPQTKKALYITHEKSEELKVKDWGELKRLAEVMVTIPRFLSLDDILDWFWGSGKDWFVWGNFYRVYHKMVFPQFASNEWHWLCNEAFNYAIDYAGNRVRVSGRWYTNTKIKRPYKLRLSTMQENLECNPNLRRELDKLGIYEYPVFDAMNILYVPTVDSIPSDYLGLMAVPMTVFDKWDAELLECVPVTTPHRKRESTLRPFRHLLNGKMSSQHVLLTLKPSLRGVA